MLPSIYEEYTVKIEDGKVCFVPAFAEEGACVVIPDVMAKNGIAHVINSVLFPEYHFYGIASLAVEYQDAVNLKTLVELVTCAGIGETLDTTFGITVFAPDDAAFEGINKEYFCSEEGKQDLVDILSYHVVPEVIPSGYFYFGKRYYPTLLGKPIWAQKTGYGDDIAVVVNGANVIQKDVLAYNGIVHIIDEVSKRSLSMSCLSSIGE